MGFCRWRPYIHGAEGCASVRRTGAVRWNYLVSTDCAFINAHASVVAFTVSVVLPNGLSTDASGEPGQVCPPPTISKNDIGTPFVDPTYWWRITSLPIRVNIGLGSHLKSAANLANSSGITSLKNPLIPGHPLPARSDFPPPS